MGFQCTSGIWALTLYIATFSVEDDRLVPQFFKVEGSMLYQAGNNSSQNGFLERNRRFPSERSPRLGLLILLLTAAFLTVSCGTVAQAAGVDKQSKKVLVLSGTFPQATLSQSYNAVLTVSGGNSPYSFSIKTGTLPPGLRLNPTTGSLSGTPMLAGSFSFEVIATDSPAGDEGSQKFEMIVGSGKGGGSVKVSVSPASATLYSAQTQQFTATVSGTSHTGVTWSATTGSVNSSGLYTAPTVKAQTNAVVTATSTADTSKSASASVTVNPQSKQSLQITTGTLPEGQQGASYSATFSATGGTSPYSWAVTGGALPPGIAMSASGNLAGTPTSTGSFSFAVTVTDSAHGTASGNFSITIASTTGYDGPAQLPIANVASSMADTPAPGSVVQVNAGGDLQSALNNAQCGNTIELQAGATFSGTYSFPAKSCDNNHWIIVRTSAPDSALPAEGQRLTPCYAGVTSLQGRPQYPCNNPQNVLAKLVLSSGGSGPVMFQAGANHYRLLGLEVTRVAGSLKDAPALITLSNGATASYIVLDRSWLHGTPQDDTRAGFQLSGTSNVAVVDSYFSDFHCVALTGVCTDAHAVSGGTGDNQDGPFFINDNFLEASGEAILFGGGPATLSPSDITVTNNHFFKPWQWMKGNTPFVGGKDGNPFVVKNHFELKNAVRVLVDSNIMENSWGGFSQTGFGILLTPKNQHVNGKGNVCPLCQVTDVTIRYVLISHAGGGIQMATGLGASGKDGGGPALAGTRWSIHDVVMDDLSSNYVGPGTPFDISNAWPKNPLNTVTINHVTGFPDSASHLMLVGNQVKGAPMYGLVFTNNLMITGQYPVWNTGGGSDNCAFKDVPITSINNCFTTYTFANNALIAAPPKFGPSTWPANNMFPQTVPEVDFTNYNQGNGGNYELLPASAYKNKGTDGKDLGADIVGLNEKLQNVQ